jgi:aminoglycoside phosphotransferase (APT) family kinase protein
MEMSLMLPENSTLVEVVIETLDRDVIPNTKGETRKLLSNGIKLALQEVLFRERYGVPHQKRVLDGLAALISQHNELAFEFADRGVAVVPSPDAAINETMTFENLTQRIDRIRGLLLSEAPSLATVMHDSSVDPVARAKLSRYLISLAANEAEELERREQGTCTKKTPLKRPDTYQTNLQRVMRCRMNLPDLKIIGVEKLSGGFSRDTYLVNTQLDDMPGKYIIRAAGLGGGYLDGIYRSIEEEFPVLEFALRHGVPLASIHFVETDPAVFGSSFILMDHSAGATVGNVVMSGDGMPVELFRTLATVLAQIHTLPWQENPELFGCAASNPEATVADGNRALLEKTWRWFESAPMRPSAAILLAYDWLRRNVPDSPAPAKVIHGDIGFHNMMVEGDMVCAVLDWEACDLGSPAWDLVAVEGMFGESVSWSQFAIWYEEAGGVLPSTEELVFSRMLRGLSGNVTCSMALEKWFEKKSYPGYLELGLGARPTFQKGFLDTARQLWTSDH